MVDQQGLYNDVVDISEDYLGPVAPRCIRRIIADHLHKKPEELKADDLPELITWIKMTAAMVTDDAETVSEFAARLNTLVQA